MLIDTSLLHFCATKTKVITEHYAKDCVFGGQDEFPRSSDDLHLIVEQLCGLPIKIKKLNKEARYSDVRGFYVRKPRSREIFMLAGMSDRDNRYIKTKELFQIYLDQEALRTKDIVDLVKNMVLRASPQSADLHLGHATNSETIAEYAAAEFLFPFAERLRHSNINGNDGFAALADKYNIRQYLIERFLSNDMMAFLGQFFGPPAAAR